MRQALLIGLLVGFLFHLLVWPSWQRAREFKCSLKDCLVFDLTGWLSVVGCNRAAQWLMLHVPPSCATCRAEAASARASYGYSAERMVLGDLFDEIERVPGLSVALFGEWEVTDGRMCPVEGKPGILTPAQGTILFAVQMGKLPPDALDVLGPCPGDPRQITEDQIDKARPLLPESTHARLFDLMVLRAKRTGTGNHGVEEPESLMVGEKRGG